MITDANKWVFIEAFLAGKLDPAAEELVRRKMAEDPLFRTDVLVQQALNKQLEQQQWAENRALAKQFMAKQARPLVVTEALTQSMPSKSVPLRRAVWQQQWVWATAMVAVLIGVGWLLYPVLSPSPKPLLVQLPYTQQEFGLGKPVKPTTIPVEFNGEGPTPGEYSSSPRKISLYLATIPANAASWRLSEDQQTGGFLLYTPEDHLYLLDRQTNGQRKPLKQIR